MGRQSHPDLQSAALVLLKLIYIKLRSAQLHIDAEGGFDITLLSAAKMPDTLRHELPLKINDRLLPLTLMKLLV